eukprot:gnl/MRDRNA2_/MRDRNA2_108108_c0_seq1.p1 gnl/MRDRNA2_/MRDRNA2_108108_c0~~gnl/MRDRNA2_/MRDRNA2_108108_c0_seq1.p1  ORF type:complete len:409 (+),score=55.31 gnl/MRDRNA2_/MRDRNA2_108108_c0_seq1:93-1229(+)
MQLDWSCPTKSRVSAALVGLDVEVQRRLGFLSQGTTYEAEILSCLADHVWEQLEIYPPLLKDDAVFMRNDKPPWDNLEDLHSMASAVLRGPTQDHEYEKLASCFLSHVIGPKSASADTSQDQMKLFSLPIDSLLDYSGLDSPRTRGNAEELQLSSTANLLDDLRQSRLRSEAESKVASGNPKEVLHRIDHMRGRGKALASRLRQIQHELEEEACSPESLNHNQSTSAGREIWSQSEFWAQQHMPAAGTSMQPLRDGGFQTPQDSPGMRPKAISIYSERAGAAAGGSPSLSAITNLNPPSVTMSASTIDWWAIPRLPGAPLNSRQQNAVFMTPQPQSQPTRHATACLHEDEAVRKDADLFLLRDQGEAFLPCRMTPQLR